MEAVMRIGSLSFTRDDAINGLKGNYGKVFHGRFDDTVDVTVIKIDVSEFKVDTKMLRETDMHTNIVRFYGAETSNNDLITFQYISIESCAGNLKELVSGDYNGPPIGTSYEILTQISTGLDFLHSKQFFHRDFKPSNILISHPVRGIIPRIKLSNFAFSPISNPLSPLPFWKQVGTNKAWMAPEIYQLSNVTLSMNIFTLGMVFAFFLSGGIHPFAFEKEERIANIKKRQAIVLTANQLLNVTGANEVFNQISLMLSFDAGQRPTASEILAFLIQQQQREQQSVLAVGSHTPLPTESALLSNPVQIPSREGDGRHSSLVALSPMTSVAADQVEDRVDNSTSQLQESCQSPFSGLQLNQDEDLHASLPLERDQCMLVRHQMDRDGAHEANIRNRQLSTNKRRTDQLAGTAAKEIKLENPEPSTSGETAANESDDDIVFIKEVIKTPPDRGLGVGMHVKLEHLNDAVPTTVTREPSAINDSQLQSFTPCECSSPMEPAARSVQNDGVEAASNRNCHCTRETPPWSMSSNSIHNSSTESRRSESAQHPSQSLRHLRFPQIQSSSCSTTFATESSSCTSNEASCSSTQDVNSASASFSLEKSQELFNLCKLEKLNKTQLARFHQLAQDKQVDVNFTGAEKRLTPLLCLCWMHESSRLLECVHALLERDELDVNFRDSGECWNALAMVCRWYPGPSLPKIVRLLLDFGSQVDTVDDKGADALIVLSANYTGRNLIDVARLLLENGSDINAVSSEHGWNALIYLCDNYGEDNLLDVLRLLLRYGSRLDVAGRKEGNALIVVCGSYTHNNLIDIVRLFIQNGIDVTATHPTSGINALMTVCSAYKGDTLFEIIEMLLAAGSNVNALSNDQDNALIHLATYQSGHRDFIKILRLFIQHKINLNACDKEAWNVLHVLCHQCENPSILTEAITLLKANGINIHLRTKTGDRPIDLLKRHSDLKKKNNITKLLI